MFRCDVVSFLNLQDETKIRSIATLAWINTASNGSPAGQKAVTGDFVPEAKEGDADVRFLVRTCATKKGRDDGGISFL